MQYGQYVPRFSFSYFVIYDEIKAKYEKRRKYHEATCDNFFIVKCLEQVVEVIYSTEQTCTNKLEQTRT